MLLVGDDWAEDHHDVEIQDSGGRVLRVARVAEGMAGMARLHELIAEFLGDDDGAEEVVVGIETDRGPWVRALVATGYLVFAVNPKQAARHREVLSLSGAKDDKTDAHTLADMVRTRRHQLRPVAADSELAESIKVLARAHQAMIQERTRHMLRLRSALRDYFPAALDAYQQGTLTLTGQDVLALLAKAPTPTAAAELTIGQITAALKTAGRRGDLTARAAQVQAALRTEQLGQPDLVTGAYAATVGSTVAVLQTLTTQITALESQVEAYFGRHPDVEIYRSQPGLGQILGARVLAEFGDAPGRYHDAKARKNYAGTAPTTRQSGKLRTVHARFIHNNRLVNALGLQAGAAILHDHHVRAYYDQLRSRGLGHHAALRQIANRLAGILHGCLKTHTPYNPDTAWAHRTQTTAA
ncbi:IS110 family transposase [Kribbella sp. NBC_00709]|uniref:IS110 family transposase n=1 Tax=Kribbella sp. NBC_00709 TaxID=2975972 RepID=UPI002E2B5C42|nr:IS110 family transposase [Kribbella sp. NBC_00709]